MDGEREIDALIKYLKVHGRRIFIKGLQSDVKIGLRALFRYYERASEDDRLMPYQGLRMGGT